MDDNMIRHGIRASWFSVAAVTLLTTCGCNRPDLRHQIPESFLGIWKQVSDEVSAGRKSADTLSVSPTGITYVVYLPYSQEPPRIEHVIVKVVLETESRIEIHYTSVVFGTMAYVITLESDRAFISVDEVSPAKPEANLKREKRFIGRFVRTE